jgi:hypothetical protein
MLAHMAAFKQHCAFDIHAGSEVASGLGKHDPRTAQPPAHAEEPDKPGKADSSREAMGSFGRITTLADLPPRKELLRQLKAGVAAIDRGEPSPRARNGDPKPLPEMPPDLAEALEANADAKRRFEAFPPSHRREYIDWINEAKQPQTRAKRLATTVAQSAEGKSQNWRYERARPATKKADGQG